MKAKRANLTIEEKEDINKRKGEVYHREKFIDDYAVENSLTTEDVLNLIKNNQLFYHKQENVLVRTNSSRMILVQMSNKRYIRYQHWVELG